MKPEVWLDPVGGAGTVHFLLKRTVAPTLVQIKQSVDPDIQLNGVINNPIGTTVIRNADGGVKSLQDRPNQVVRTAILDIEATTDVGTAGGNRVNVDEVDSTSWQVPTSFLTSQASGLTNSIFLGLHRFYAGEQVRYNSSDPIGGLTSGRYYFIAAITDLSVQLAETGSFDGDLARSERLRADDRAHADADAAVQRPDADRKHVPRRPGPPAAGLRPDVGRRRLRQRLRRRDRRAHRLGRHRTSACGQASTRPPSAASAPSTSQPRTTAATT